jgi:hypothetical protein
MLDKLEISDESIMNLISCFRRKLAGTSNEQAAKRKRESEDDVGNEELDIVRITRLWGASAYLLMVPVSTSSVPQLRTHRLTTLEEPLAYPVIHTILSREHAVFTGNSCYYWRSWYLVPAIWYFHEQGQQAIQQAFDGEAPKQVSSVKTSVQRLYSFLKGYLFSGSWGFAQVRIVRAECYRSCT